MESIGEFISLFIIIFIIPIIVAIIKIGTQILKNLKEKYMK